MSRSIKNTSLRKSCHHNCHGWRRVGLAIGEKGSFPYVGAAVPLLVRL